MPESALKLGDGFALLLTGQLNGRCLLHAQTRGRIHHAVFPSSVLADAETVAHHVLVPVRRVLSHLAAQDRLRPRVARSLRIFRLMTINVTAKHRLLLFEHGGDGRSRRVGDGVRQDGRGHTSERAAGLIGTARQN